MFKCVSLMCETYPLSPSFCSSLSPLSFFAFLLPPPLYVVLVVALHHTLFFSICSLLWASQSLPPFIPCPCPLLPTPIPVPKSGADTVPPPCFRALSLWQLLFFPLVLISVALSGAYAHTCSCTYYLFTLISLLWGVDQRSTTSGTLLPCFQANCSSFFFWFLYWAGSLNTIVMCTDCMKVTNAMHQHPFALSYNFWRF